MTDLSPPRFYPRQRVRVIHLGAKWDGRVLRAVLGTAGWVYDVEYLKDQDFVCREFWDDEIEERE